MLLMLGLAMLFGFSERAFVKILGQFEDQLGGREPGPPPRRPTDGIEPPQVPSESATKQPPSQAGGVIVTPLAATGSSAISPLAPGPPARPPQRTPTTPGLPAPTTGQAPPKPPKPSGA